MKLLDTVLTGWGYHKTTGETQPTFTEADWSTQSCCSHWLIDERLRNLWGSWPVKLELMNIFVESACACTRDGSRHLPCSLCFTCIKISKTEILRLSAPKKLSALLCKCSVACFYLCPKRTPLSCWSRIPLFCFVLLAAWGPPKYKQHLSWIRKVSTAQKENWRAHW